MKTYERILDDKKTEIMVEIKPFEYLNLKSAVSLGYVSNANAKALEIKS